MLVTFENIEQIYKLLTTTDLSTLTISTENLKILLAYNQLLDDTEYNEENRKQLKKLLQDNFNEINSSKVAETINDHRAKFTGNIDEHLHEARLDCINYLLPKIYELSEVPEIKAALKDRSLPLDNIDEKLYEEILPHINELLPKICNSHEISQIKKLFNKEPLLSKDIDQSLYKEILPYTKLLSKMYNVDEAVLAKRLATYFSNIEEVKGYLETVNYTNSDTILWSFQDEQKPDSSNNTKPIIALSYNAEVGGDTAEEAKERIMEQDGNVIYIDYRKIVPLNTKTQSIEKILEAGKAKEMLQNVDGLIIPGNEAAVYPELFDSKENFGETDKERSIAESILIDVAIQKGIPITGICGGHQLINVYFGGKLANVDELDYSKVRIDKDLELARITKNSSIVEDLESAHLPPQKFWASHKQIVKKIGNLNFINPVAMIENEIVATESEFGAPIKTFQFHPEILSEQSEIELERNKKIFKIFVETCNNYRNKKINLGEIKQDIEIITEPQDDNHENEISVENLKDFRNSIKEISSKISTNKYSTFEEIETNNKRLQQIIISKKINRDLNEKEIALINLGVTAKQFIEQDDDLISTLCNNFYGLKSLIKLGFTLEEIFNKDIEEQTFLVQNGYNVKTLIDLGISLETLFSKDTEEQKFLIQYAFNIKYLTELGFTLEEIFSKDTEEQKFLIQNGYNVKTLIDLGISLETLFSKDNEEQKFLIQYAFNIKYLTELGFTLEEIFSKDTEEQKFLIQNGYNVKTLVELGISLETLFSKDTEEQKFLIQNGYNVKTLTELGISLETLFSKDTEEQKFLIQNGYNVKTLVELGISLETLFSKDIEEQKFFIQYGYNIKTLTELGISLETLFSKDIEEQKFFIQYGNNIKLLTELGISLETLFSKDTEEQKFFIQNGYNIKTLTELGISLETLLNKDTEEQKFFIQNAYNIKYLKEIGISIPELVAMESEQQKFLIQYTSNVKYSIETKFPTAEQKLIIEAILIKKLVSLSEFHNMGLNQQKSFVENIDFKKCDAPVLDQEITDTPVIGVASEFPTDQA